MSLLIVALLLLWSVSIPPVQLAILLLYAGAVGVWSLAILREERRRHA